MVTQFSLSRTRKKDWHDGYVYFLPSLRLKWNKGDVMNEAIVAINLVWLTFSVALTFYKWRNV